MNAGPVMERVQHIYAGRVIRLDLETVRLPNGVVHELEIVHHPGGAAIVAVDARRRACLIRQFRHAAGGFVWELPAGKLEPREAPQATAQRELAEEAGMSAQHWQPLGTSLSSPGVFTEVVHLYLAQQLAPVPLAHEPAEVIEIHWLPLDEACGRALRGEISDAKTVIGLLRARAVIDAAGSGG